nr:putative cytochrome C-type biogenesis protein [uncultured bacterium pG7]
MLIGWAYGLLWIAVLLYIAYTALRRHWLGLGATSAATLSWSLLTAGLADRGLAAGHWPLVGRYEFPLCFTWAILTIYLALETAWHERRAGAFVLVIALVVAGYAVSRPSGEKNPSPLLPVLRSAWLQVHVLSAVIGYGAFAVAAGTGLARLPARDPSQAAALSPDAGDRKWLPAAADAERMMEWSLTFGFPWLTFAILTGAIWAQNAWGRYWGWDPKETWSLAIWLWYLLILHLRPIRSWRGRRLAILAIIGLGLVFFSFVGVPWLVRSAQLESLHGF